MPEACAADWGHTGCCHKEDITCINPMRLLPGSTSLGWLQAHKGTSGIALIEAVIAILLVAIGAGAALSGLTSANQAAEVNRSRTAGLALCQERIDVMVASPFSPPSVMPACFGTTWPVPSVDTVTSTESINVYADPAGTGAVSGTRTTSVSMADATLKLVRVTTRVSYTYRGSNHVCESYSLRSPD